MSEEKMSKRQMMREKRRKTEARNRWITIGLVVAGAFLVAFALIYPNLKPVGEVAAATPSSRPMADDNSMGDPNAPIKIEEFSDYQCPYCRMFSVETEPQLIETYIATGKVHFTYRSFGEYIGPESQAAAEAAYCAGEQDKYWEYHDTLFANHTGENVGDYTDRRLVAFAEMLDLDMGAFRSCFEGGKFAERVGQDYVDGSAAGVQATPSFVLTYVVNGETKQKVIPGAYPFSEFQTQIEAALAEMGAQ
ncbi:MAG: DsbA family protein [Chloroflexota bacterium]